MKEIIYEGCVDGDTPSVSWKPETPDQSSSYKSQKAPIRVALESPEQIPGQTYRLVCRYSTHIQPFSGESTLFGSRETWLVAPIEVPVKVAAASYVLQDGSGRDIHIFGSSWTVPQRRTEYIYTEDGYYVLTADGQRATREIIVPVTVLTETISEYFEMPQWGTIFGEVSFLSAEIQNYDGSVVSDLLSASPSGAILTIKTYDGEAGNPGQAADDAYWSEVFRKDFTQAPENIQVDCDCEADCVKIYRSNQSEFFCICRDEEDKDLTANKERIKQEVKAELFPVLKSQIKSEVISEIKAELKADEAFKTSLTDAIKNDETFKNAIKTFLLENQEFKDGIKDFLLSDEDFKKELIKDFDPESAGQTIETATAGIYGLTIRLKNGVPNRVGIPMPQLPWEEDPIILQTLTNKYSRSFVIGNWQPLNGQLVAPLS